MKKAKITHYSWFLRDLTRARFFPSMFDLGTRAENRAEQRAAADVDVESRLAPSLAAHAARSALSVPPGIDRGKERRKEGGER